MNKRAAKRIRIAAMISHRPYKQLKREYMQLPYHRRTDKPRGFRESHRQVLGKHAYFSKRSHGRQKD